MKGFIIFLLIVVSGWLLPGDTHAQVNVTTNVVQTNITLVWEAQSYTPPFYKGKALMPDGGDVKILAFLPPGVDGDPDTVVRWRVNGMIDQSSSGVERTTYIYRSPVFGGQPTIVAEAFQGDTLVGTGAIRVPVTRPRVLVYPDTPLGGVLFNVENPSVSGAEIAIETYPLFFTAATRGDAGMTYRWTVNGRSADNPLGNASRLVLRSETSGTTTVSVATSNSSRLLESAKGATTIFLK